MSRVKALWVPSDGEAGLTLVEGRLESLQAAIGGGYLEAVSVADGDWHAYVDEEGKLKDLPINVAATRLVRSLGWPIGDIICGTAIFLGDGEDGEEASVPDEVIQRAIQLGIIE